MPRTLGDGMIHVSHMDQLVNIDQEFKLPELNSSMPSANEQKIGKIIAENLVVNGATLQMGEKC